MCISLTLLSKSWYRGHFSESVNASDLGWSITRKKITFELIKRNYVMNTYKRESHESKNAFNNEEEEIKKIKKIKVSGWNRKKITIRIKTQEKKKKRKWLKKKQKRKLNESGKRK